VLLRYGRPGGRVPGLYNLRRLLIRWEYHQANFLALIQLGCILILMRNYL